MVDNHPLYMAIQLKKVKNNYTLTKCSFVCEITTHLEHIFTEETLSCICTFFGLSKLRDSSESISGGSAVLKFPKRQVLASPPMNAERIGHFELDKINTHTLMMQEQNR